MATPVSAPGSTAVQGTWDEQRNGVRQGLLFPYVGKEVNVFRCPADTRRPTSSLPFAFRTFSIVGGANGETWSDYTKITLYTEIKNPSMKYVFVEEADTRGGNIGSWQFNPKSKKQWVDPVSMWHNKKTTLGFADGHAEMHTWENASFIAWCEKAMYDAHLVHVLPDTALRRARGLPVHVRRIHLQEAQLGLLVTGPRDVAGARLWPTARPDLVVCTSPSNCAT